MLGKFISFEGPEGGGKTTQCRRLMTQLQRYGHEVLYTREPGGTRTGEIIRSILQHDAAKEPLVQEAEVFLFSASRTQLCRQEIIPALERGAYTISDRFFDSTSAYQGYGRGFPLETILAINAFAVGKAIPDVTLLLDVPVEVTMSRLKMRRLESQQELDRFEREERPFFDRVRNGYLELAKKYPERIKVIDATRSIDAVEQEVWKYVEPFVTKKY